MWTHLHPELLQIEADTLDEAFKRAIYTHFASTSSPPQTVELHNLPLLRERIRQVVAN